MNREDTRPFLSLQVSDLERWPVWQSLIDQEPDVTVFPVKELPTNNLIGKVVGTKVRISNGDTRWAILLHLDSEDSRKNAHIAALRIERQGNWFDLARYWDLDYSRNGPDALARFLGLSVDDVFPISYDVRNCVIGEPEALIGVFSKEPHEALSEDEIIRMIAR